MIRFIIEAISRDGNAALNICLRPDGSIEEPCVKMLEEVGAWMNINGEAVYGSRAWTTLGEGDSIDGKLKKMPGGGLGRHHANFHFHPQDIRFTIGKNEALYAFCMAVPETGQIIRIKSLGKHAQDVKQVSLLGYNGALEWTQTDDALEITCPMDMPFHTAVVFKIM